MFVHSSRIKKQIDYLSSLGIDTKPLFKQTGISKDDDFAPDKTFNLQQYKAILEFALRQTGNPDYGLDFGNNPQLGGTLGTMCASCQNLREAFIQGCQFLKIMGNFAELQFIDDQQYPKLVYRLAESWVLQDPLTAKLEVDAMFSFLNLILKINSNNSLKPKSIRFTCTQPENATQYETIFGIQPDFGTESNEMAFHRSDLLIPMKAFNPETFQLLKSYLQDQLKQSSSQELLSEKVKRIIHSSFKYQFPDIDTVAEKLNLSSRSLQRKLAEEKTSFKSILQDIKFAIAKTLIRQNNLTISEISYTLGYSDLGNFSRSFKKYEGVSPQEFRDRQ